MQNTKFYVILSQCTHWRENPFSMQMELRIATPACGLVRNDKCILQQARIKTQMLA